MIIICVLFAHINLLQIKLKINSKDIIKMQAYIVIQFHIFLIEMAIKNGFIADCNKKFFNSNIQLKVLIKRKELGEVMKTLLDAVLIILK